MKRRSKQCDCITKQSSCSIGSSDTSAPLFFFSPREAYGEFCQWYPVKFTVSKNDMSDLVGHSIDDNDPDGWQPLYFNCAEQFMMYCKAGLFHDSETQKHILDTQDPKEQKRLGRLTKDFQPARWDKLKTQVMVLGNLAKFSQNQALGGLLLDTRDRVLAEAAAQDPVWGIGFAAATAPQDQERWGENRLGVALMEVRTRLRRGEKTSFESL